MHAASVCSVGATMVEEGVHMQFGTRRGEFMLPKQHAALRKDDTAASSTGEKTNLI